MNALYHDRTEAGEQLARHLAAFQNDPQALVLGLPRGGIPVAAAIARHLHVPLDVLVVRKLGVPGHEELAMGAIAHGGVRVMNDDVVQSLHLHPRQIERAVQEETHELLRRERAYRGEHPHTSIQGHTVILVDDGLATGATMRAAIAAVRQMGAHKVIVAVPVGSWQACEALMPLADQVVCLATPEPFIAIGPWYDAFPQITDAEVRKYLAPDHANLHNV